MSTHRTGRDRPADRREVDKFDRLAPGWWDPDGPMRALHRINPVRLAYIKEEACRHFGRDPRAAFPLEGLDVLDIGCGAGLLCEPLARLGGTVTGLDPAAAAIAAARDHAAAEGLDIAYREGTVGGSAAPSGPAAQSGPGAPGGPGHDLVVAMEVVEHVPDVPAFVRNAAAELRPGGLLLLATINRTLRAFGLAIVGAEYVLRWLPRGTHDWEKFVTPAELRDATGRAGLAGFESRGMVFDPLRNAWRLSPDTAVNYLARAEKPA